MFAKAADDTFDLAQKRWRSAPKRTIDVLR